MTTFLGLLASEPFGADPSRRRWSVPSGWSQGRGGWGGLAVGACVSAAHAAAAASGAPDGLRLRHLAAQLMAPLPPGDAELRVEVLRAGSATLTLDLRIIAPEAGPDGEPAGEPGVVAHATAVLGAPRRGEAAVGDGWRFVEPPEELAAGAGAVPEVPVGPPVAPEFLANLAVRPITGFPGQGVDDGRVLGWVSPRLPAVEPAAGAPALGPAEADVLLAALADAWWLSSLAKMTAVRPVATLGFVLDLPGGGDPAALVGPGGEAVPLLHRGRLVDARDGYVTEVRELWAPDGELLTVNTQTVAIIR